MACEYLILNASDINIQDFDGLTPLFCATQLGKFSIKYFVYLLEFLNQHLFLFNFYLIYLTIAVIN